MTLLSFLVKQSVSCVELGSIGGPSTGTSGPSTTGNRVPNGDQPPCDGPAADGVRTHEFGNGRGWDAVRNQGSGMVSWTGCNHVGRPSEESVQVPLGRVGNLEASGLSPYP